MRLVILLLVLAATSPVSAGVRAQGFLFDMHAGGGAMHDDGVAPAATYGLGVGFALDRAASMAAGIELDGMTSWTRDVQRDRGSALLTFQLWLTDPVSLKLGAGAAVGPRASDGDAAFAALARVGYDVMRWQRTALVLSLGATHDTTAGPQLGLQIGFEIFSGEKTMNLWNPPHRAL